MANTRHVMCSPATKSFLNLDLEQHSTEEEIFPNHPSYL